MAQKSSSQPICRAMLKILWNTQKTPTKHAFRHLRKCLKIRLLADKSGSRLRCRIMLNSENTTKHVLMLFEKFLKLWFSAQKFGSLLKCRTMLKNTTKRSENTTLTCFHSQQLTSNGEMSGATYTVYNFADDLHWPELRMLLESIDYHEAARKASFLGSMCEDPFMAAIHFERRFDALSRISN